MSDEGLREELAEAREQIAQALTTQSEWQVHSNPLSAADAFLRAVPAVAEALATVEAVRALAEEWEAKGYSAHLPDSLRRALDGE